MKIDLSGHTALVTGASGQLGRVIARTLAECGAEVAVHYLSNESKARQVAQQIGAETSARTFVVQADVADAAAVRRMRDEVTAELGAPDIIVTNAVAQYEWKQVLEQGLEDYESQFRSCVLQNVIMAQTFVPAMMEKGWGRVVAISTECAVMCTPTQSAYVSGKRGMDGVLRCLAREVGEGGVTVNQVAPGWTISQKDREAGTEKQAAYEAGVPLRRRGEDSDIANAVAFLSSDLAGFITGAFLPVCGGNVMAGI